MNNLQKIISGKETDVFKFKPNKNFYERIGINRKRFGMLIRNEIEATYRELQTLSKYFDVSIKDLIKETPELV